MARNLIPSEDYIPPELIGLREPITPEQFEELCSLNRKLRLELTSTGELIIMPPTGFGPACAALTSLINSRLGPEKMAAVSVLDSNTIFSLPNGAQRSPDAAWIKREKWDRLTEQEKGALRALCPDFVVELRSISDRLTPLSAKMVEWMENGASLG